MSNQQANSSEASAAPGQWEPYANGLFMRTNSTDAGRLVRLADIVRWVMHRDCLPVVEAVNKVADTLQTARPAPALFRTVEHSFAAPVAPDDSFGFFTEETIARAKRFIEPIARGETTPMHPIKLKDHAPSQFLIGSEVVTSPGTAHKALCYLEKVPPVQPGAPAAAQYMREYWASTGWAAFCNGDDWACDATLDKRELRTCGLSVSIADAVELWGWGLPTKEPEPAATDFAMLASREQLIAAFGAFTDMNADWFRNLKDTPALLAARRITGQGGRGHLAEPYFCPFAVMQWLVDGKRKKGRPLSGRKGWELLERHFPMVYASRSIGDPREAD